MRKLFETLSNGTPTTHNPVDKSYTKATRAWGASNNGTGQNGSSDWDNNGGAPMPPQVRFQHNIAANRVKAAKVTD